MRVFGIFVVIALIGTPLSAQWYKPTTPGVPRTEDGKPDLAAETPRTADGKPTAARGRSGRGTVMSCFI